MLMLETVAARSHEFDIVHFHVDPLHLPLARRLRVPSITTLHGRLDLPYLDQLYREYGELPLVSISDAQRAPMPWANWVATVHHGLPKCTYRLNEHGGNYLVFTGRIAPEKRPDWAIEIARRAGLPLRIAAKVSKIDQPYFDAVIRPLLDQPGIEFLGEVNDARKQELIGGAIAMLFPIDWPEPFGIVMIESMACGTPVIAFDRGSVREVVDHGRSGLIVRNVEEAVLAVQRARRMNRRECRACFDQRFAAERMVRDYVAIYCRQARDAGRVQEAPEDKPTGRRPCPRPRPRPRHPNLPGAAHG
jgi:glycosyltransferase involved in cell wall biosynthesis